MQPANGGRIALLLQQASEPPVRYRATLETAEGTWPFTAFVDAETGAVRWQSLGDQPEPQPEPAAPNVDQAEGPSGWQPSTEPSRGPKNSPALGCVRDSPASGPPQWLVHYAESALRQAWKQNADKGWPRRMTRWRSEPQAR